MTAYAVIGYNNLIDSATLAGGDWATGAAASTLNNLKTRYLRQYAVSDGASNAATQFTIDLGSTQTVGVIALCNHNLTPTTGQVTITGAADASFTQIAWRGNNMQVYSGTDFAVALPDAIGARYWKAEILDSGNASGYVRIGRVFIGPAFAPLQGLEFGNSLGVESRAGLNEAWSGMEHFESRRNRRVFRATFNHLKESEALQWLAAMRTNDTTGEVYLVDTASRQSGNMILAPDVISDWSTGTRLTAVADTTANPIDAAVTADTLTETSGTELQYALLYQKYSTASVAATQQVLTLSMYIKDVSAGRYPVLQMAGSEDAGAFRAHFNTSTKATLLYSGGNGQTVAAACTDAGNGWTRCSITGRLNWAVSGLPSCWLYFDDAFDLPINSRAGDTGKSMTVWGAMLNYGTLSDYIDAANPMVIDTTCSRGSRSFLGRLRALSPIEWPYINQYATAVEISEML